MTELHKSFCCRPLELARQGASFGAPPSAPNAARGKKPPACHTPDTLRYLQREEHSQARLFRKAGGPGRRSRGPPEALRELSDPQLRQPCRKVLESLEEHWTGLIRFVDDPRIPLDNNASERAGRGPAVARKNFYGSGSLWSGRLAAAMFSLLATLARWKLNPRLWLTWYLESCAAVGGKAPHDIQPFLPWNLSDEHRAALAMQTTTPAADTS